MSILSNTGTGFAGPVSYVAGVHPISLALGDFDANGLLDIAMTNDVGVAVITNVTH